MTNLIKTKDKAISCVAGATQKEFQEISKALDIVIGEITSCKAEKLMVLNMVLREMVKLKPKHKIGFDFGGKKEFELKRIK